MYGSSTNSSACPLRQVSTWPAQETPRSIRITYKVYVRGVWRTSHSLDVNPSDSSEVERVAVKYIIRRAVRLFDTELNILNPGDCFEAVTARGNNTVLLIPETDINIKERLEIPFLYQHPKASSLRNRGKRAANKSSKVALSSAARDYFSINSVGEVISIALLHIVQAESLCLVTF